jgi:hypothetical protein
MDNELNNQQQKYDDLLDLIPDLKRGDLAPSQAHMISLRLDEDPEFKLEVELEDVVVDALTNMRAVPMPPNLLAQSLRAAVGDAGTSSWFSLDTILVALGVGVGCAAFAQFLTNNIDIVALTGKMMADIVGVSTPENITKVVGGITLASIATLASGVVWIYKMIKA